MRDIRNLLDQGVAQSNFGCGSYKDAQNQERPMFLLTKKGLEWGENQVNPSNTRETQPMYYIDMFEGLYDGLMN